MGKKKQALRELEEDVVNAEEELQAVKWELAATINRVIELGGENDRLHDENELLRQTIVDQALSLFGIVRDASATAGAEASR